MPPASVDNIGLDEPNIWLPGTHGMQTNPGRRGPNLMPAINLRGYKSHTRVAQNGKCQRNLSSVMSALKIALDKQEVQAPTCLDPLHPKHGARHRPHSTGPITQSKRHHHPFAVLASSWASPLDVQTGLWCKSWRHRLQVYQLITGKGAFLWLRVNLDGQLLVRGSKWCWMIHKI